VLTSHQGRPEAIELCFGDEGPDRTMVVHQRVIISADCDGYLEEAVYLRFTAVPPKEVH
jgi:hypothetical protein